MTFSLYHPKAQVHNARKDATEDAPDEVQGQIAKAHLLVTEHSSWENVMAAQLPGNWQRTPSWS